MANLSVPWKYYKFFKKLTSERDVFLRVRIFILHESLDILLNFLKSQNLSISIDKSKLIIFTQKDSIPLHVYVTLDN